MIIRQDVVHIRNPESCTSDINRQVRLEDVEFLAKVTREIAVTIHKDMG